MRRTHIFATFVVFVILIWGRNWGLARRTSATEPTASQASTHWMTQSVETRVPSSEQLAVRTGPFVATNQKPTSALPELPILSYAHSLSSRSSSPDEFTLGDFKVTAYTNSPSDTGKRPGDKDFGITASGAHATAFHTIAADWRILPAGTRIRIEGLPGEYVVQDTGGAVKGRHIDVFMSTEHDALQWGVKERKITILEWGGQAHG